MSICHKAVAVRGGNTSNLTSHLKTHHPLKHEEFRKLNAESQHSASTRNEGTDSKLEVLIVKQLRNTIEMVGNGKNSPVQFCIASEKICCQ